MAVPILKVVTIPSTAPRIPLIFILLAPQITWTYHYALNRMDNSLMYYSYLPAENGLLAAVDLPHFVLGVTAIPADDSNYGAWVRVFILTRCYSACSRNI